MPLRMRAHAVLADAEVQHATRERVAGPLVGRAALGDEGRGVLDGRVVGLGEVGRAAPQLGHHAGDGVDHRAGRLAGRHALGVGVEGRERVGEPDGQRAGLHALEGLDGVLGRRAASTRRSAPATRPAAALPRATRERVCSITSVGTSKCCSGSKPRISLVAATSSSPRAEPWDLPVPCALGAGQAMTVSQDDEAGPVGDLVGGADGGVELGDVLDVLRAVVGPVDVLDVPAVGLVARADVLGERDVGVALDRDLVGVVDHREVAELLGAGDRGGLGADALLAGRRREQIA